MVQIGGVVFFILAVFVTILFTEGYGFDTVSRELVKKSVVLFEKIPSGASVTVDGKTEDSTFSGELRLASGSYNIEISKPGAMSWKKRVKVPEDSVVRFAEIILFPTNGAVNFIKMQEPRGKWRLQSVSQEGVLLYQANLHFGKWIPFDALDDFAIREENEIVQQTVQQAPPLAKPMRWFSRIGKTFHFLFLNEVGELKFCDEDEENCVLFAKGASGTPVVSEDKEIFFVPFRDTFTWFDFEQHDQTLPNLLKDLVSAVF